MAFKGASGLHAGIRERGAVIEPGDDILHGPVHGGYPVVRFEPVFLTSVKVFECDIGADDCAAFGAVDHDLRGHGAVVCRIYGDDEAAVQPHHAPAAGIAKLGSTAIGLAGKIEGTGDGPDFPGR